MAKLVLVPFDPAAELGAFVAGRSDAGACASFVGLVRGENATVAHLALEHYPGFTEASLEEIEQDARSRFDVIDLLVIHRAGEMEPGEAIVLAAALSHNRKAALSAVDYLMDRLKTDAAFWKREIGPTGAKWIEPRADDYAARATWERKS